MRILVLGNNYVSKEFYNLFSENEDNIVFSDIPSVKNCIEFENINDILEFCCANDINLVLINNEEYIDLGLQELLTSKNISAFSPSIEAISIANSKANAKKFMYKNKIQTPKFAIMEKTQLALDYIKNSQTPLAIRPDFHNSIETVKFCETYNQGQQIINELFSTGNKKIIIEDYIEGKNISVWAISDGFSAKIIGTSAKYQDEIAIFEPDFITAELKEKILNTAITPTINALSTQNEEYIGVLGFDFILTYTNELFLVGYNSFFDDINVNFFTKGYDINWAEVFDSCIVGDVFLKYQFSPKDEYMLAIKNNEKIDFISAKTLGNLEKYIKELNYDINLYKEAKKIWKY